jgi:DNA polymerase-3 subunit delta'
MNVPGQKKSKSILHQLASSERVPHALMLAGPTGSGNLALALTFVQMLQCSAPTENGPCGSCKACAKSSQMVHPDIHFSYPTIGTNVVSTNFIKEWRAACAENPFMDVNSWLSRIGAENKQGNINKEECNAIIKKLNLKLFEGPYKILLMWLPEYLGKEGNRLLKLIEEPPEKTLFVFVAENPDLILPTILSRCQLIKTETLSDEELVNALKDFRNLESDRAAQIAFLANGDLNQAFHLIDNPENDDSQLLLDWLRKCWKGNGPELVGWTEAFAKLGRENQKQFLNYGLHYFRELLSLLVTGSDNLRLQSQELASAINMAKVLSIGQLQQIVELVNDNIYYIERNANPKTLFLNTSIQIHRILKNQTNSN